MTPHFTDAELECRCGCGGLPSQDFQDDLELLRMEYGRPMNLSSAYRCPDYNLRVSPSTGRTGPHTMGAVDVLCFGEEALRLTIVASAGGWTGVGISQKGEHAIRFIHLDRLPSMPPRPWIWSY